MLDIGCGTGAVMRHLAGRAMVYGIDVADEALQCSARRGLTRLSRASALALPFPDDTFDAAALFDVLYHRQVPDPLAPLWEAYRVLRPDGCVFVNVPAYAWLYSSHDVAVHTARRFTRPQVVDLLAKAGFRCACATYWNTLLFPPIAVVRMARKWTGAQTSDLDGARDDLMNRVLSGVLDVERGLLNFATLPFGLSVFAVGRKQA
jgi:ubiquinone/menaquinone biosynthesis C-methylase UbiE